MIQAAEHFIYIESQYLIGSGSEWGITRYGRARSSVTNGVPEALVNRIKRAVAEGQPFHVYIVLPMFPEGDPSATGTFEVRYLQWCTMEYMIKAVYEVCGGNWTDYLSFYCLANWENTFTGAGTLPTLEGGRPDWTKAELYPDTVVERAEKIEISKRYMIYVHSKFMLADDRYAIIGSANLNERSLNGDRDSEICVALWPINPADNAAETRLRNFRKQVWEEHLGREWLAMDALGTGTANGDLDPGSPECARLVAAAADQNFLNFMRGVRDPGELGHIIRWPLSCTDTGVVFNETYYSQVPN
ncbi:MAG: phospholipase D-like domain-containing protein, partial [Chloroflexi bacterium]|nr:phospholipase D-like domain-containing protein [Chloroflexota bacterium]